MKYCNTIFIPINAVSGKMCCLPLAATAWLCAYMRTAPQDTLLKPINMVQQLLATSVTEEDSLRDRWQLTCEIIRKMQRDVQLPLPTKSSHHLVSRQPATEQLHTAWTKGIRRGWLDHNSARILHCLLDTAGSRWLVSAVIQELLKRTVRRQNDDDRRTVRRQNDDDRRTVGRQKGERKSDGWRTNGGDRRTVRRQKGERNSDDRRTNDDDKRTETRRRGVIRKFESDGEPMAKAPRLGDSLEESRPLEKL
ncbi:hypothetical protein NQ318_022914, partial [Aromia moschata]